MKRFLLGVLAVMMCLSLFGCGKSTNKKELEEIKNLPQGTMVFDYYEKRVGLPIETGHDEIVLLISDPGKVEIDVYHKPDGEGAVEACTKYQAPDTVIDDVYALVYKYQMMNWEKMKNYPIDGMALVMKFRYQGKMMRVNAETITEKYGQIPFGEVQLLLEGAVQNADIMQ